MTDFAPFSPHSHPVLGDVLIMAVGSSWLDVKLATGDRTTISKKRAVPPDPDWPPAALEQLSRTILSCRSMPELRRLTSVLPEADRQCRRKALECNCPEAFAHLRKLEGRPLLAPERDTSPLPADSPWRSLESQRLIKALVADGCTEGIPVDAIALALAAA